MSDLRYPVLPLWLRLKRPDWKKPKWRNIAAEVAERDSDTCQMCGWVNLFPYPSSANRDMPLDHIIPLCRGGTNEVSNFQLLCQPCNQRKAHWLPWEL